MRRIGRSTARSVPVDGWATLASDEDEGVGVAVGVGLVALDMIDCVSVK